MVQCVDVVWAVDSDGRKTVRTYLAVTKTPGCNETYLAIATYLAKTRHTWL